MEEHRVSIEITHFILVIYITFNYTDFISLVTYSTAIPAEEKTKAGLGKKIKKKSKHVDRNTIALNGQLC